MSRARHRKQSQVPANLRRAGAIGIGTGGILLIPSSGAQAEAAPSHSVAWDIIADCESNGQNIESHSPISSASGFFQIVDGTWLANGGGEFAQRAIQASYAQQIEVAKNIYQNAGGSFRDWNASRSCWAPQFAARSAAPAPKATPAPKPKPAAQPAPVEKPAAKAAPVATDGTYEVVSGDWLSKIAPEFDMTTQALYDANRDLIGDNPNLILPGQILEVTGMAVAAPLREVASEVEVPADAPGQLSSTGFAHPAPGARVTSGFGDGRGHDGLDFDGAIGDPAYSATDGAVIFSGFEDNGYGIRVDVEAPDGTVTRYAHLSATSVSVNDYVAAGQQVGKIGNTGDVVAGPNGDGSHLHFEVILPSGAIGGGPTNPAPWLADRGISV